MTNKQMLVERGIDSLSRAAGWLRGMADAEGIFSTSSYHAREAWPGMSVPATYNAVNALTLLAGVRTGADFDTGRSIAFLLEHQDAEGRFAIPGMKDNQIYKKEALHETREYIDFHVSNYAREAVGTYAPERLLSPIFAEFLCDKSRLRDWLSRRDWSDPWLEGNAIVNAGGFLLELGRDDLVHFMLDGLEAIQNRETGFWGERPGSSRNSLLHTFAGAMHIYHLYYLLQREIPHAREAVDAGLSLAKNELAAVSSACLDVDIVDMLASLWPLDHRRKEIESFVERKVEALISVQNEEGGFYDEPYGIRRFDGWVGGYWEPQGLSNCFATWFRSITIAVGLVLLEPGCASRFCFRRTVGIGFFDVHRIPGAQDE